MPADDKKGSDKNKKLVSEKDRFRYIGFDVFPGKPKDLFKSEAEKNKLVTSVKNRRESGDTLRDQCTLTEERVSLSDRLVLTVASIVLIASLFLPWFSAYNEVVEESNVEVPVEQPVVTDSTMLTEAVDSLGALAIAEAGDIEAAATEEALGEDDEEDIDAMEEAVESGADVPETGEEILHSYVAKKKITKNYSRISGLGSIISVGSVGSYVFSSGIILMLSGVLVILMVLSCLLVPLYNLYGIYAFKGDADTKALALKKILKYNWIPLILFMATFVLSFIGANYGFGNPTDVFTSIGNAYSAGVFFGSISYGVIVSLCASILIAAKGMEI